MPNFICLTCGTQFAETDTPPEKCEVCTDERQYVGWQGQHSTTFGDLRPPCPRRCCRPTLLNGSAQLTEDTPTLGSSA